MQLNITNGLYFNEYIKKNKEGVFVPFNEALMDGELLFPLFHQDFMEQRIAVHNVTKEDYLNKMQFFFEPETIKKYSVIRLWFGLDAFCQINMLALLAYLEQIEYKGKIFYQAIDDASFETLETKTELTLGTFISSYQNVMRGKSISSEYDFINRGIDGYLYVKNRDNRFYRYIKENLGKLTETQLIIDVLKDSAEFGLSDMYIQKMIEEVLNYKKG